MRNKTAFLALIAYALVWSSTAQAGLITITSNRLRNQVRDRDASSGSSYAYDSYIGTSIPTDHQLDATLTEDFYSRTHVDYSGSLTGTTLTHTNSMARDGGQYDYAYAYDSSLYFTANANTTYDLSGLLEVDDISDVLAGRVVLHSYLRNTTTGQTLFNNYQESRSTIDEIFNLGETTGDTSYSLSGSLTGNLVAGHQYQWYSYSLIHAYPDADDGATATGFVTLSLGDGGPNAGSVVPEPTSLAMFAIGGLGMIARRRRRAG
ncbi:MAG: PEP-CTERM sorting domain-containing protein [Planctomycetota bacterium]